MEPNETNEIPMIDSSIKKSVLFDGALGLTLVIIEIIGFIQGGDPLIQTLLVGFFIGISLISKWLLIIWEKRKLNQI